jgi:hypothetical protein
VKLVAAVPPKLTTLALVKPVPVIVTEAPAPAVVGVKEVIVGVAAEYVNPVSVPVPPAVVTLTAPVVPVPTTAVICVAELTVKLVAAVPPKLTALALVKPVPVIVTEAPAPAVVGVNELIVGAVVENVNPDSVPVPTGVVTLTDPVAPVPTNAVICVSELTVKLVAAVPPKLTVLALVKPVPVITTELPVPVVVGVKDVIVGTDGE